MELPRARMRPLGAMGDYTLTESLLRAVTLENHLRDVRFELELGVMNVGGEARLPPGGRLRVTCKDFVAMRAGREPWQALRQDPRNAVGWMQDGRKTVVGFGLEDPAESELLREIGPRERELRHLVLSTTDAVFDVVCAGIEVDPPPST